MSDPLVIQAAEAESWPKSPPKCVERQLEGLGSVSVHAYTFADWSAIRTLACTMQGVAVITDPSPSNLALAHVVYVCRTGPGSTDRTFRVEAGRERDAALQLAAHLPGPWVDAVRADSTALSLVGYHARTSDTRRRGAHTNLEQLLADPGFWAALDYLSLRLYGVPITANNEPLAAVLTMLESDAEAREQLVGLVGALAGAA